VTLKSSQGHRAPHRHYLPFEVYAKSLQAYFSNYEQTAGDWERDHSRMYPVLDQYQRDGYGALLKIGGKYGGAFLCDGVGLGKTFVGLMLIERLVKFERKKVLLVVPKSGREPVWESSAAHATCRSCSVISPTWWSSTTPTCSAPANGWNASATSQRAGRRGRGGRGPPLPQPQHQERHIALLADAEPGQGQAALHAHGHAHQ
jgi:hypothetical protein